MYQLLMPFGSRTSSSSAFHHTYLAPSRRFL